MPGCKTDSMVPSQITVERRTWWRSSRGRRRTPTLHVATAAGRTDQRRRHDFRRPDRLGKEALRAIQTIQRRRSGVGQRLTGCLGRLGEFPAQSMEQTTWADYSDKLPRLTSFVLFRSKGFDTPFFFNLPPKVFYAMLDRLLGGEINLIW